MSGRIAQRLLIIGWDAADWIIIDELFARGEMPNLRQLVQNGVRADLSTLTPKLSPLLWSSIATGKTADKHGILNFVEPDPTGQGIRLSASTSRRTNALWNILTQAGLRTNVVSWYASHPAEPINGTCVSNLFQEGAPATPKESWPLQKSSVHPVSLEPTIANARVHPNNVNRGTLLSLVPMLREIDPSDQRLNTLTRLTAQAASVHNAACAILASVANWDCTMVFLDTIDTVGHHFMQYHPPRLPHVSVQDFKRFRDVMGRLYQWHDVMLGQLLKQAGPGVTVMLLSDHGFYSDDLRPVTQDLSPEKRAEMEASWHRPQGVLVMSGPGIKRDERIAGPTLLDIAPTALVMLGLPIGKDMDGRALLEAFETAPQVTAIPSWDDQAGEAGLHPPDLRQDPFEAHDAIRQLIDLGYMAALPEDQQAQIDLVRRESRFNLATVFMSTGRPALAIPVFRELVRQRPDEPRYVLPLASCLSGRLQFSESIELLRDFLGRHPGHAEARLMLANTLTADGHSAEARTELQAVQQEVGARRELQAAIGDVLFALQEWDAAEQQYRQALAFAPRLAAAHLGLARVQLWRGKYEPAAEHALDAIQAQYALPEAHHLLGVALAWLGDLPHAVMSFNMALSMSAGLLDARRFLILIHERLGDDESATRHRGALEQLLARQDVDLAVLESREVNSPMSPRCWSLAASERNS